MDFDILKSISKIKFYEKLLVMKLTKLFILTLIVLKLMSVRISALNWKDFEREMKANLLKGMNVSVEYPQVKIVTPTEVKKVSVAAPPLLSSKVSESIDYDKLSTSDSVYRLIQFYASLNDSSVKRCPDTTKLLPDCVECIPGLQMTPSSTSCSQLDPSSVAIRKEIIKLAKDRFGNSIHPLKPFALYPYLESPEYMVRQETFATMIDGKNGMNIVDIGAYYNPINFFFNDDFGPSSIVGVEPILQAVSAYFPCKTDANKKIHIIFLPITFKLYKTMMSKLPTPDSVICIGCDSIYGPNRRLLETTFQRPFTLYLEYPSEYYHNGAFRKMMGTGPGEELIFSKNFEPVINTSAYNYPPDFEKQKLFLRSMKVLSYK